MSNDVQVDYFQWSVTLRHIYTGCKMTRSDKGNVTIIKLPLHLTHNWPNGIQLHIISVFTNMTEGPLFLNQCYAATKWYFRVN